MLNEIVLNETTIKVHKYEEEKEGRLHKISVEFPVRSEDYHDITTLLYKGTFDVKVPERDLAFRARFYNTLLPLQIYILKGRLESLN
ncbi:hypothetical protein F4694_000797 [Bacillus niacini]|uniref:DUF3219 family protein n=1 Tax=Neobacillus niacini TaxID=86668 RepID=A0A852T612_9BACI|nr:hypothetical protein [Neobacillus niacini]